MEKEAIKDFLNKQLDPQKQQELIVYTHNQFFRLINPTYHQFHDKNPHDVVKGTCNQEPIIIDRASITALKIDTIF